MNTNNFWKNIPIWFKTKDTWVVSKDLDHVVKLILFYLYMDIIY